MVTTSCRTVVVVIVHTYLLIPKRRPNVFFLFESKSVLSASVAQMCLSLSLSLLFSFVFLFVTNSTFLHFISFPSFFLLFFLSHSYLLYLRTICLVNLEWIINGPNTSTFDHNMMFWVVIANTFAINLKRSLLIHCFIAITHAENQIFCTKISNRFIIFHFPFSNTYKLGDKKVGTNKYQTNTKEKGGI